MKIGLVLGGGGCKGAYEIGVWKALKELKIDMYIQGVSGTSIGALNAALFALNDYNLAESIWMEITREKALPTDNVDLFAKGIKLFLGTKNINFIKRHLPGLLEQGNVSRQGLMDILDSLNLHKALSSSIPIYAACAELPDLSGKYFKLNEYPVEAAKKILCASSAIPPVFPSEEIESVKYVDGGLFDNLPIKPLYDRGFDMIFVINLDRNFVIDRSSFPKSKIICICPSSDQGGVFSGILDFSNEGICNRIRIGYEDTMNLLEPIFEFHNFKLKKLPGEILMNTSKNIAENVIGIFKDKTKDKTKDRTKINGIPFNEK
ncbi:MAG: patatin-like phospholipase family protein [Clostridiaceae bacterium]|nr:patatin-like phospholipase family protein [Clostridiaceae bacterium]